MFEAACFHAFQLTPDDYILETRLSDDPMCAKNADGQWRASKFREFSVFIQYSKHFQGKSTSIEVIFSSSSCKCQQISQGMQENRILWSKKNAGTVTCSSGSSKLAFVPPPLCGAAAPNLAASCGASTSTYVGTVVQDPTAVKLHFCEFYAGENSKNRSKLVAQNVWWHLANFKNTLKFAKWLFTSDKKLRA